MAGEVTFTRSEADYIAVNQDWYWHDILMKRKFRLSIFLLLFPIICTVEGYILSDGSIIVAIVGALPGLMLSCLFVQNLKWRMTRESRKRWRQTAHVHKPITINWSDEGLALTSPRMSARYAWTDFHRWRDGRTAILFFYNDSEFLYVPHAGLDAAQLADLRATISRAMPS